ncbi:MAG: aminoacyl-tRNA hydrolase [Phreatobacter sp.]|uniref:aminoacyl-tRNA hydrolase n=1 Tax=Phreatobacter sp. TaxID=1966341 RepID=UPI001A57E5DB|nr:aminoacyl-tRNA hydrolase [Phreatobacter sp.]MBL8567882.1 aminoacyl-tRNA hydrolase [Phreatobacter sp.]
MILLAGLGNPGAKFRNNRHNIGFMAAEAIHRRHRFSPWRQRFQGLTAEGAIGTHKALLLMPGTYMNESGRAVGEAMRFFKIELGQVVVFHDELDLPPAKLRVKTGGGNAGHNGLRSITAQCGNDYRRVRMGIGHPGDKNLVHSYVLNDFAKAETPWVEDLCDACADQAELLAAGDDPGFQNRIHLAMEGRGWSDVKRPGEAKDPSKA